MATGISVVTAFIGPPRLYAYIILLITAIAYLCWLSSVYMVTAISINRRNQRKVFLIAFATLSLYFILFVGEIYKDYHGIKSASVLFEEVLDSASTMFCLLFIYMNIRIGRQFTYIEGNRKSSAWLSLVLIFAPILSLPFLHKRIMNTLTMVQAQEEQ